jgi:hypothetical protein
VMPFFSGWKEREEEKKNNKNKLELTWKFLCVEATKAKYFSFFLERKFEWEIEVKIYSIDCCNPIGEGRKKKRSILFLPFCSLVTRSFHLTQLATLLRT